MRFGIWEIIVIVLLVIILFGSAKIPGMMKNLASGIKVFKKEIKSDEHGRKSNQKKSKKN
ncbi:MAG: twin-arginine translocase TatA/TatE family subunit [Alphaproteobacteria bacterium]|nr:twin-arginine translocase TatA/TatE family subunit [Alphaproteobacteria bacterium]